MNAGKILNVVRLAVAALVLIGGAYWAGGRWGERQPRKVEALPLSRAAEAVPVNARDAALTDDEAIKFGYDFTGGEVGHGS